MSKSWIKIQRLRRRWLFYEPILAQIEAKGTEKEVRHELSQKIKEILRDGDRAGTPIKFSAYDYCQILGVALEKPILSDCPINE